MKTSETKDTIFINNGDDTHIDLRGFIENQYFYWKWYALCIILSLLLTYLYLEKTPNQYLVTSSIIIDDEKGGLTTEMSAFQDLGVLSGPKTSLINEIGILSSQSLLKNVLKNLKLNVTYYNEGTFLDSELYGAEIPLKINFFISDSIFNKLDVVFMVSKKSDTKYVITNEDNSYVLEGSFGTNLKTKYGEINITPSDSSNFEIGDTLIVRIQPLDYLTDIYKNKISIEPQEIKSSVLILSLSDPVKRKAEDILNNLVSQYNTNAITYKQLITENTDEFINDRIVDISSELSDVDEGVESFKVKNRLTDIDYEANLILDSKAELENQIIELSSQIKLIDFITDYINNNKDDLIPSNLGLNDYSANESALTYNRLLMERNRIVKNSSLKNPTVVNLDAQIATLRQGIEQSLSNLRSSLSFSLNEARSQNSRISTKREQAPQQEREFKDIKRKQLIIETLYLYLLQKREENAISLGMPVPNAKVVDFAFGSSIPVSPSKKITYAIGLLLGLFLPMGLISIISILDNKIHSIEDIENNFQFPLIGDIPKTKSKKKIVVTNNDRDSIAEAFRLLRTNINFMLSQAKEGGKIIMVTSTIGGEGKTFISINLSAALAFADKKVLLIGADLRKPKVSQYLNQKSKLGLSEFLADERLNISDIIEEMPDIAVHMIHSGGIPPNPSELFMNGRFDELLDYAKDYYDYVIIDTSPVHLVTDTLLISHYSDLTIYVVRANFLDKRLLRRTKMLYEKQRLPNMALLLNDTNIDKNGYGYGYGYGGLELDSKKPWFKRIFN